MVDLYLARESCGDLRERGEREELRGELRGRRVDGGGMGWRNRGRWTVGVETREET